MTDLNRDEAKNNSKWPTQKKTEIFNSTNSQNYSSKITGIGPWISGINGCEEEHKL